MSNDINMVQAIYTFKGKNNDELCFKKGDIITVTQREEGGWWEGTLGETTGWFPSNYVKEFRDVSGSVTTSPVRTPAEVQNFRNVVLKDIIDSEKAHVAELQGLIVNFLQPLEKSDILTKDEYRQLTGNILEILNVHEELLALVEECGSKTGTDQRVGGLFLQWAPKIKSVHQTYCSSHPRAVCILDKYKEELNNFMEKCGAVCPGILVLTTGLSKPFRRLDKYAAMLQELGRHVLESHPDRGDTHRAVAVYKDIASTCSATRRQKELELQVVTGAVRGWQSIGGAKDLASLGEVLHMGGVALGDTHADRYFVLFPSTLLILSVSRRMSAFVYEGCLPLTGISVAKLEDSENRKNAFEIRGALIDSIVAVCQSNTDAEKWVSLLCQHSSSDVRNTVTSTSLPHSLSQKSRDSAGRPRNPRDSLYHVTMPPSTYPSAAPYAALSKYFAKLVRLRVITRNILKQLLYLEPRKPLNLAAVKFRHRHTNQVTLRLNNRGLVESDSESETDTDSEDSSSGLDQSAEYDVINGKISRQNALDLESHRSASSVASNASSNPFGYIRYYNSNKTDENSNDIRVVDCTHEIFEGVDRLKQKFDIKCDDPPSIRIMPESSVDSVEEEPKKMPLCFINQYSEGSNNSSFDCANPKPYMACEDLVNLDQNLAIETMGYEKFSRMNLMRHSCPTKFVANKFNDSSLTSVCTPGWYPYENVSTKTVHSDSAEIKSVSRASSNHSKSDDQFIQKSSSGRNLKIPCELSTSESTSSDVSQDTVIKVILDPPPMFRNDEQNHSSAQSSFEKHLLNSDKKLRRSMTKESFSKENSPSTSVTRNIDSDSRKCVSCSFSTMMINEFDNKCSCCDRLECHSPRSSDSGVAGSCNLASPEIPHRSDSLYSHCETRSLNEATYSKNLYNDYSMSTGEISKINYAKNRLISDLEAAKYEEQCPCTSPFSTPRTSENVTNRNLNSITTSFVNSIPQSSNMPDRTDNVPILYRRPSRNNPAPKNVREAALQHGWSNPNISIINPSRHYHVRLIKNEEPVITRPSRPIKIESKPSKERSESSASNERRTRSKSEDLAKKYTTVMSPTDSSPNSTISSQGNTNHKRSHSFNNHHSYTQYLYQQQKQKSFQSDKNNWIQSSCDALSAQKTSPINSSRITTASSFSSKISDFSQKFVPNSVHEGWSIKNLRPAPPLRPLAASNLNEEGGNSNVNPYAPMQRKINSYEEDALILRVIEAYCTSARSRKTVNSEWEDVISLSGGKDWLVRSPSLPLNNMSRGPSSLWATVVNLQAEVKHLKTEMKQIRAELDEDRQERILSNVAALAPNGAILRDAKESNC